jgi:CYTH domain-containing protein
MAQQTEVERKFRVQRELLPDLPTGSRLAQGYLSLKPVVRVRTERTPEGVEKGYLTIKGEGLTDRAEFEYEIPYAEATSLLELCQAAIVCKTRHRFPVEGAPELSWELDVFEGENDGLIIAEVELPDADHAFPRPSWLGEDVSHDAAYQNVRLAQHPFSAWPK